MHMVHIDVGDHTDAKVGQPGLHSELLDIQGYLDIPCLKTKQTEPKQTTTKIGRKKGTRGTTVGAREVAQRLRILY